MNPPRSPRRITLETRRPGSHSPHDDSGDTPLTGEELIGDLDPGWLAWSAEQANR